MEDNDGAAEDKVAWNFVTTLPTECPVPSEVGEPIRAGDVTVVDAPPLPATKAQCKHGGWVQFGFKNRGQCVAFVRHQARRACIFERVAHGVAASRAKYGIGPRHQFAMWSCVHGRIGF